MMKTLADWKYFNKLIELFYYISSSSSTSSFIEFVRK